MLKNTNSTTAPGIRGVCPVTYPTCLDYRDAVSQGREIPMGEGPRLYEEWKEICLVERRAARLAEKVQRAIESPPVSLRDRLVVRQEGRCFWCARQLGEHWHVDHHIPRALGGSQAESNKRAVCITCNQRKGRLLPSEFALIMAQDFL